MNKPHKHEKLIKQWAEGAEIECYCRSVDKWHYHANPMWTPSLEYRVKPKPKWTPRFYIDEYGTNEPFPDQLETYNTIHQFIQEFETDWGTQNCEVFKDFNEKYNVILCDTYPSLGVVRMSKECADKLCEMLNNGEIEL